jgi:hypothetical protein
MGGAAHLIPGQLAAHLIPEPDALLAPTAPPALWRRLFGRRTGEPPERSHVTISRNGDRHFEIMPGLLKRELPQDFMQWLRGILGKPSVASSIVLEYLGYGGPTIYVRGLHRSAETTPEYWVQVSFSGCAGEAQVSANVAAHWAARWYAAKHEQIRAEYLVPFGFVPEPYDPTVNDDPLFLPAGELGYLEVTSAESRRDYGMPTFIMDHALQEAYSADPRVAALEEVFVPLMSGRCRCQVCEPEVGDLGEAGRSTGSN